MSELGGLGDDFVPPPVRIEDDSDLAAVIALAGLPNLTPRRFWSLIALGRPSQVWRRVVAGRAPRHGRARDAAIRWARWSASVDPDAELIRHEQAGVVVVLYGHQGYPAALLEDPDPPVAIFSQGPGHLDDRVRVGVVGTRGCSRYGRDVAYELGASLAHRGVDVVSGLAHGIDAAAHAGAGTNSAPRMVAVVAGGVDIVYPPGNAGLYNVAATKGVLLSEWPLGARPERWRFPARNRLVAALSSVVVVVESPEKGGSMYTVDEALRRDRPVFAVPGPIQSPVSAGTNRLIADGAQVLCNIDELLDLVAPRSAREPAQVELGVDSWLLELVGWQPMSLDDVAAESRRSPNDVALEVERLIAAGALRRIGGVIERSP